MDKSTMVAYIDNIIANEQSSEKLHKDKLNSDRVFDEMKKPSVTKTQMGVTFKTVQPKITIGKFLIECKNQNDHYGNSTVNVQAELNPSAVAAVFLNDPDLFYRFMVQYNGAMIEAKWKREIEADRFKQKLKGLL